jgi:hypothetical protein
MNQSMINFGTMHIKVKERPFTEGSRDCKFYKTPKIMILTSFELSLPPL